MCTNAKHIRTPIVIEKTPCQYTARQENIRQLHNKPAPHLFFPANNTHTTPHYTSTYLPFLPLLPVEKTKALFRCTSHRRWISFTPRILDTATMRCDPPIRYATESLARFQVARAETRCVPVSWPRADSRWCLEVRCTALKARSCSSPTC